MDYQAGKQIIMKEFSNFSDYMRINDGTTPSFLFVLHLCAHISPECQRSNVSYFELLDNQQSDVNSELINRINLIFLPNSEIEKWANEVVSRSTIYNLLDISCEWYNQYYTQIFEEIFAKLAENQPINSKEYSQPHEIGLLIKELCRIPKNSKVLIPFAGMGELAIDMDKGTSFYAHEENNLVWAVGILRCIAHGIDYANYKHMDSFALLHKYDDHSFDYVISTPPFAWNVDQLKHDDTIKFASTAEEFLLEVGPSLIKENGCVVEVCSLGLLFRSGKTQVLKQNLINNDWVDTIILLPQRLFSFTSIQTAVIILTKDKKHKGFVRFVDGSTFFETCRFTNRLDYITLVREVESENPKFVKFVSNQEVAENDFNLIPSRYLESLTEMNTNVPDNCHLSKLSELVTLYRGPRIEGEHRLVRGKDLANDLLNSVKTFENLSTEVSNNRSMSLNKDLILVWAIGNLKPTYFKYDRNIEVCINPNILALDFYSDKIDPQYLINELNKDYVIKQVEARSIGVSIKHISAKDLLDVKIIVPDTFEIQKQICEMDRNHYQEDKIKEMGIELSSLRNTQLNEYEKNMRLRKHALSQVLGNFSSAFNLLKSCKDKHNGVLRNEDIVALRTGETVEDYFRKMSAYVLKVEDMVSALVDRQEFGTPENVWLESFIKDYVGTCIQDNYSFDLRLDNVADYDYHMPEIQLDGDILGPIDINKGDELNQNLIFINKKDLRQVFDNIVTNAIKYGFTNAERKDYVIRIELSRLKENGTYFVVLKIANNGSPLPQGMNKERFFHWGVGNGTGLGTWQVKNIVEHYGGNVHLNLYDDAFSLEYEIRFPVNNVF